MVLGISRARLVASVGGVLVAAVALTGCSVINQVHRTLDPVTPKAGECWVETYGQVQEWESWEGEAPVKCSDVHESYTYAIAHVSRTLPVDRDDSAGNVKPSVDNAAFNACNAEADRYWPGADTTDVLLNPAYYIPSLAQWKAGARWVRCDIGEIQIGSSVAAPKLAVLPERISTLSAELRADPVQFKYCINNPNGDGDNGPTGKGAKYADCSLDPDWILITSITIPGDESAVYPAKAAIDALIKTECSDKYLIDYGSTFAYYPSKKTWTNDDDRGIDCWGTKK